MSRNPSQPDSIDSSRDCVALKVARETRGIHNSILFETPSGKTRREISQTRSADVQKWMNFVLKNRVRAQSQYSCSHGIGMAKLPLSRRVQGYSSAGASPS